MSEWVVTLVPPKHVNLLDPQLRARINGATCWLTVQRPALRVWADAPLGQSWSDNFFHLRPGVCTELLSNQGDQVIRHHSLNVLIFFGKGAATASGAVQNVDHRPLDPSLGLGHVVDFQFGLLGALATRL